jgi:hypothetical protein
VGFEPTIPAFGRAKTVDALDRAATVFSSIAPLTSENTFLAHTPTLRSSVNDIGSNINTVVYSRNAVKLVAFGRATI